MLDEKLKKYVEGELKTFSQVNEMYRPRRYTPDRRLLPLEVRRKVKDDRFDY